MATESGTTFGQSAKDKAKPSEAMLESQREETQRAKAQNRYKGRVPTARRQAGEIVWLKSEGVRPAEIARKLGIGRASVYRVLGEHEKVAA